MIAVLAMICFVVIGSGHSCDSLPLWRAYVAHIASADGRVINRTNNNHTTSEVQNKALFFALVANGRKSFAQLLCWTKDNLSAGRLEPRLLAWFWGRHKSFIQGRYHFAVKGDLHPNRESQCISQ